MEFREKGKNTTGKIERKYKTQWMEVNIKNINIGASHRGGRGREWSNLLGVGPCLDLYFVNYSNTDL